MRGAGTKSLFAAAAALTAFAAPNAASAAPADYLAATDHELGGTTVALSRRSEPEILGRVVLTGRIPIPAPDQSVTVAVRREGKPILLREVKTNPLSGRYRTRLRLKGCCEYVVQVRHGTDLSSPLGIRVEPPATLEEPRHALLFNRLLRRSGYHMGEGELSDEQDEATGLAIMALRKVHDMERTEEYSRKLFAMLLKGDGRFEPVHREDGRHVEVDISRQVMALVEDGEASDVFHVSTGSGGTPRGEWRFYDKGPGYNAKGMYYSVYYDGNYATHGFSSVPAYPASHGCTRNPMPYAVFIYNWIELGDTIYVYD